MKTYWNLLGDIQVYIWQLIIGIFLFSELLFLIYLFAFCSFYFVGVNLTSQTRMCILLEDSKYFIAHISFVSPTFSTAAMYFSKILSKHLFTFSNCRFSKQALKHIIIAIRISSQSEYVIAATLLRIPISQRWPSCISQQMQTWQKWFIPLQPTTQIFADCSAFQATLKLKLLK